jgi:hypothetical protein
MPGRWLSKNRQRLGQDTSKVVLAPDSEARAPSFDLHLNKQRMVSLERLKLNNLTSL